MQKYVGAFLVSSFAILSVVGVPGGGRWRAVPYVAQYGRDMGMGHHRQGHYQGHGGGGGGYPYHYPANSHGHQDGGGDLYGYSSYHYPIPTGGKSTYIQKLIPILQLGSHFTSFLQKSHKRGWQNEDSHQNEHGSIWSASGHPHPVPIRGNYW